MPRHIRIATYNVNGVNGRLPRLVDWLRTTEPTIACLQELKTDDSKFPAAAIKEAGYYAIWHGQRAHHGVAVLAKDSPPKELRRGLPGEPSDAATRYLEARVDGLTVCSVYLPNGNPTGSSNYEYKIRWFKRLIQYSGKLARGKSPAVLAGDLNVVPTDRDIANPWWWRFDAVMQPEVRELYKRLIGLGWIDTARVLHPTETIYTFWTTEQAFQKNRGFRLDFLLVNRALAGSVTKFGVDTAYRSGLKPSDHAPTWIEIDR